MLSVAVVQIQIDQVISSHFPKSKSSSIGLPSCPLLPGASAIRLCLRAEAAHSHFAQDIFLAVAMDELFEGGDEFTLIVD